MPTGTVRHMPLVKPQPGHPADRLLQAIQEKRAPVCVGIDPVLEKLPKSIQPGRDDPQSAVEAVGAFCSQIIQAVAPYVPCVKFQSACFERYSALGIRKLRELSGLQCPNAQLEVILDAKRGDIGISAEHYATDAFESSDHAKGSSFDWITINSYLGEDGITPFLKHRGHGAFALVRTSNPGGDELQNLQLQDGRTVAHAVAQIVSRIGSKHLGESGYSALGAVVGATKPQDATRLREIMPQQIFLVPGYGAQGGGANDVLPCFKTDGTGAIVTASRSVIYAFKPDDPKWQEAVADAAARFADEIGRAVAMR